MLKLDRTLFRTSERMTLTLAACAVACILLSLLMGAFAALYYVPEIGATMKRAGISLMQLRPLHTTFASAWIYLGAVTCVYAFLFHEYGEPDAGDKWRFKAHMVLWGVAGLGVLVTLPFGVTSGREYLGFHPFFSLLVAAGWVLFAITFFKKISKGFWSRPVYVYMWACGILLFLYTFAEGHAYLFEGVRGRPVVDLQVQWKSCGTLVAAFNQMVYGSLIWVAERMTGDRSTSQSKKAFALLGLGMLNSFTNYAHHTYHLPQSHLIKWIAFVVSMLEILILVGVYREVVAHLRKPRPGALDFRVAKRFIELSKCWNLFLLSLALLISIPPLNALIHGTHVVMAHAMGSELAIDSYILFAVFAFLFAGIFPKREVCEAHLDCARTRKTVTRLNLCLILLVALLLLKGLVTGVTRYLGLPAPAWTADFPYLFAAIGLSFAYFLLRLVLRWVPLFVQPERHKLWFGDGLGSGPESAAPPSPATSDEPVAAP
ncbi:MAG: cbb3-type cytochrome c oxidase subunit I [Planctomycetota bacterium]|jgi:nitric oxide reductase subunit B